MSQTRTKSANCNKAANARAVLGPAFEGRNHVTRMSGFQRTDEAKASDSAKVDVRISDNFKELTEPELHDVIATFTMSTMAAGEIERHMDEFERAMELSKDPSDVFIMSNGKVTHLDDNKFPLISFLSLALALRLGAVRAATAPRALQHQPVASPRCGARGPWRTNFVACANTQRLVLSLKNNRTT